MEVSGKIKIINETRTFGTSGFKKREVVITTNEQYAQPLLIEFVQDKCDLLDNYKVGDEVTIAINLRGKEWLSPEGQTKYFNSINGWRIQKINNQTYINRGSTPSPLDASAVNDDFLDSFDSENTDDKFPF